MEDVKDRRERGERENYQISSFDPNPFTCLIRVSRLPIARFPAVSVVVWCPIFNVIKMIVAVRFAHAQMAL